MSFEDRSIPANDRIIAENTPLITGIEQTYRKIRTTPFIIIHIFLMVKIYQTNTYATDCFF